MTLYTDHRIIIVTADAQQAANALTARVDIVGGAQTFTVGLVPDGARAGTPPTHYICDWRLTPADQAKLETLLAPLVLSGQCVIHDGEKTSPDAARTNLGLQKPLREDV